MSKAFTRENDDFEPESPLSRARPPGGTPQYLTADGAERLRQEMATLTARRRQIDEGGDDADRRDTLRRINARMHTLSQILADADVVAVPDEQPGEVRFGMFVTIRDGDGTEDEYRIVGVDEVDLEAGWISWLSPLATALLGKKVGDLVHFVAPVGERNFRVVGIRPRRSV